MMWFTMPILLRTAMRSPLPFVTSTVAFMAPAFSAIPIRTVSSFGMPHLRKSKRPFGREMSPNRRRFSPAAATNTDKMASAPSPYNLLRWIQRHLRRASAHASRSPVPAHRPCKGAGVCDVRGGGALSFILRLRSAKAPVGRVLSACQVEVLSVLG